MLKLEIYKEYCGLNKLQIHTNLLVYIFYKRPTTSNIMKRNI
jgi:hypothetical protein